jgi:hypothetical protein
MPARKPKDYRSDARAHKLASGAHVGMSPSPSIEAACLGCFLHERTGGVCPAARDLEAERRAEELRVAVRQDARTILSLSDLVCRDAERHRSTHTLPAVPLAELTPATDQPTNSDSRKEAAYVHAARPVQ